MSKFKNALNSTTSNKIDASGVIEQLDDLRKDRELWEGTFYQASCAGLYELLAKCLHLYQQLNSDKQLNRRFRATLKSMGIKVTDGSSLATIVVRYVFGDCGQRAYTYGAVLTIGNDLGHDALSLPSWIISQNGVENIRRTKGVSKLPSNDALKSTAIEKLDLAKPIAKLKAKPTELVPNSKASHSFSAALVRQSTDGGFEIVYASNKIATVNTLLNDAGKQLYQNDTAASVEQSTKAQSKSVSTAVAASLEG